MNYKVTFEHIGQGEHSETVNSWVKASDLAREMLFTAKRGATITIEVLPKDCPCCDGAYTGIEH